MRRRVNIWFDLGCIWCAPPQTTAAIFVAVTIAVAAIDAAATATVATAAVVVVVIAVGVAVHAIVIIIRIVPGNTFSSLISFVAIQLQIQIWSDAKRMQLTQIFTAVLSK